jgi:hypothetical protein
MHDAISVVSYLCAGWDVVAVQLGVLMDKPGRYQWDRRMAPHRLVEHGVQVHQPRQMILCDHLVAADILDLPVETILMCQEKQSG